MAKLKSRNAFPPQGWQFIQPQTGWQAPANASFDVVVRALIDHRKANPFVTQQNNLSLDYDAVADEVDSYNAERCFRKGWKHFLADAGPAPSWLPQRLKRGPAGVVANLKKTVAGVKAITDWIGSGMKPVDEPLANSRAEVCSKCPLNSEGGFWEKLDARGAEEVKTLLSIKSDLTLKTKYDDVLKSCTACLCWNPLKVWVPIQHIKSSTSSKVIKQLHPKCWVLSELNIKNETAN